MMEDVKGRIELTKRNDGVIISTIKPPFLKWYGEYETAIALSSGDIWRIAESYNALQEALDGHLKYSKMSRVELENLEYIG